MDITLKRLRKFNRALEARLDTMIDLLVQIRNAHEGKKCYICGYANPRHAEFCSAGTDNPGPTAVKETLTLPCNCYKNRRVGYTENGWFCPMHGQMFC